MARSTWVAHEFEWEKLLKCHLKGKASGKLANGQNIDYSEKNGPRASSALTLGLNTIILKHVYWYTYMQQISGERVQDHWSSGFTYYIYFQFAFFKFYIYLITVNTVRIFVNKVIQ